MINMYFHYTFYMFIMILNNQSSQIPNIKINKSVNLRIIPSQINALNSLNYKNILLSTTKL